MKDWWLNLVLREKIMLAIGALVVMLFLFYELLWSSLINANNNLRTRMLHNQETLLWMRQADQRMQSLLKASEKNTSSPGSLLGIMQTALQQSPLNRAVAELRQVDNDSVEFNCKKVDFDQLIIFLTALWNKQSLLVSQMTVIPGNAPGEVSADVLVQQPSRDR